MGRSLLKSQLERLSALEPKPSKTAAVATKTGKNKKSKNKRKSAAIPPPLTTAPKPDGAETDLGYFRATLTSKASEKAREAMSRALGIK